MQSPTMYSVLVEVDTKDCTYESGLEPPRQFIAKVLNNGFEQMGLSLYAEEAVGSITIKIIRTR